MASTNFHTRSNSLPSRPHPCEHQLHELLSRLNASTSIRNNLNDLQDVYDLVDSYLELSKTQQVLLQNEEVDKLLHVSLRLLDVCGSTKDALLQSKQYLREIQSALRRRQGNVVPLSNQYLTFRKKTKKAILKHVESKKSNNETVEATLREVEGVTFELFRSLLSYIYGKSKKNSWISVSKLILSKRVACEDDSIDMNEFEKVDSALRNIIITKGKTNKMCVEKVQEVLGDVESSMEELEHGLECLHRRLIKSRVSLLNVLDH